MSDSSSTKSLRPRIAFSLLWLVLLLSLVAAGCGGAEPQDVAVPGQEPVPMATQATPSPTTAASSPTPPDPTTVPEPTSSAAASRTGDEILAPELKGISSWINSEPFTLASRLGKVVLIDFWTYTCINCIRTLPYLKEWHDRYAELGLVIVGVHSPEFEFEKDRANVEAAIEKHGLKYAVAQDNDFETWRAFDNKFWPAKYLIDNDGYIRYTHFGEGSYEETEAKIRELLLEAGAGLTGIAPELEPEPVRDPLASMSRDVTKQQTRELYAGFERNYSLLLQGRPPYVAHSNYFDRPDMEFLYEDTGVKMNHHIYLQGLWRNDPESLTHARETEVYEDYIAIIFYARTVNVVMSPGNGAAYDVRVTVDGKPLGRESAGADIEFDEEGNSYVTVGEADMYRVIKLPEFEGHLLKLSSNSSDFEVFAYTFGSYL